MKILHYTLGLPPYRSGGLTQYSTDLMLSQISLGHKVVLLYPGKMNFKKKKEIIKNEPYHGVDVYEVINPLPVPLRGGVKQPKLFMQQLDNKNLFHKFLQQVAPDVIHVHTLMGIYREFFEEANRLKIKIVYTTHDYFGICPTVNLFKFDGKPCESFDNGAGCAICNNQGYSLSKIRLMQSHTYKGIKNSPLIRLVRSKAKKTARTDNNQKLNYQDTNLNSEYVSLRSYYYSLLKKIDLIHYNSSNTRKIYEQYLDVQNCIVEPITNAQIMDHRTMKKFEQNDTLRMTYLGPTEGYKGFYLLYDALKLVLNNGYTNWHLNVYGNSSVPDMQDVESFVTFHGRYKLSEEDRIFNKTDLLIVPSIWYETFGLIVPEGLSYGVPILATNLVGAIDLIEHRVNGLISQPNETSLSEQIEKIINNRKTLEKINRNICSNDFNYSMQEHTKKIVDYYKKMIKGF